jgi:uncharacterized membrane protein
MMEAANTSEMLINFYQTTNHKNPEDSHLQLTAIRSSNLTKHHFTKLNYKVHWQLKKNHAMKERSKGTG